MGESMSLLQKRYDQALTDLIDLLKGQRGGQAITNGTVVEITPPPGSPAPAPPARKLGTAGLL